MTKPIEPPFYPIIYLRGYAMTLSEMEDTVADPYMGFNLGSTKVRQRWNGQIVKYIFESPLIRLMKDHYYRDVYEDGDELRAEGTADPRTIWIFRYYDESSQSFGQGKAESIEKYALRLGNLIEQVRDLTCGRSEGASKRTRLARESFKVYLVAHSMGGLIARCYLQTVADRQPTPVDKVFTYGTPHGGIDLRGLGNVPSLLSWNDIDNFNESRMREYLKTPKGVSITSLNGTFDPRRFFCVVGTNYRDYEAAAGLSKRIVGPMSDGLVLIKNAVVEGAPRAFVNRAHSGHYGVVNSEEAYQNLRRFLFGDVRAEAVLKLDDISLPKEIEEKRARGKTVRASYHVEAVARVRGRRWDLHRRVIDEDSAILVPWEKVARKQEIHLVSAFLMRSERVNMRREALGFSVDLGVLVPEYEVDGVLFLKQHFEGGYLFRDKLNLEVEWKGGSEPILRYGFDSKSPNRMTSEVKAISVERVGRAEGFEFRIPISQDSRPGLRGELHIRTYPWNQNP